MTVTVSLAFLLLWGSTMAYSQERVRGFVPPDGFVPNAATAKAIAEAVLIPIYKRDVVLSERPFKATLKANIWIVVGTVPCETSQRGAACPGGAAEIHISRKTGQILFLTHGQ